jgi:hypothetical protein
VTNNQRKQLQWASMALELAENGLKNALKLRDTTDPATCSPELWNVRAARFSLTNVIGRFDPKTRTWIRAQNAANQSRTEEK